MQNEQKTEIAVNNTKNWLIKDRKTIKLSNVVIDKLLKFLNEFNRSCSILKARASKLEKIESDKALKR